LNEWIPTTVVYAVPLYRTVDFVEKSTSFIRLFVRDELLVKAYKHLLHKFGYYLSIKYGVLIKEYDPVTGAVRMLVPRKMLSEEIDLWREFSSFTSEYFIPKLQQLLKQASAETILSVFYRRSKEEGSATGLAPVIMLGTQINQYPNALEKFNVQGKKDKINKDGKVVEGKITKVRNAIESNKNLIEGNPNGLFLIEPKESSKTLRFKMLGVSDMASAMTALGGDASEKRVTGSSCVYCGSKEHLHKATGKLGVGRVRFAHEKETNFSDKAKICLRCMLVALFYVLDVQGSEVLKAEIEGVEAELKAMNVQGGSETERVIKAVLSRLTSPALTYNTLLGDDKLRVKISGLNDEAIERLSLLKLCVEEARIDEAVDAVIDFVFNPSVFGSVRSLLQALKQLEKWGGSCMSHVSKYLFTRAYVGREEEWVALTIAKISSGVMYIAKERIKEKLKERTGQEVEKILDEELYPLRTFAEEVRNGSLTKALAYVAERYGSIPVISVLTSGAEDKEMVKRVLDKFGFKYEEEGNKLKIYADSIPIAEAKLRSLYGLKVYEDAHTAIIVMNQDVLTA